MSLLTPHATSAARLLHGNHNLKSLSLGKFVGAIHGFKNHKFLVRGSTKRRKTPSLKKLNEDESSYDDTKLLLVDGSSGEDDFIQVSPKREVVLQACTVTSALIALLGIITRQVSHVASMEGLPIHDSYADLQFGFEMWHLELITGSVILISSLRYLLLRTWPDFAESTEAANRQVLTSLEPLDYVLVAFLPGVSEELLFRGALIPIFGNNLASISVVAAIFGALHLGNGRKYSFAVWATFVGFVYGYAVILSSSVLVPMASHALNNLVGAIIWRYSSKFNRVDV